MIILHEHLPQEAEHIAEIVRQIYNIPIRLDDQILRNFFPALLKFQGHLTSQPWKEDTLSEIFSGEKILILTPRDLYCNDHSKDDDWIFGYSRENVAVVTVARMKKRDRQPSETLHIPEKDYLKRIATLAVHEIGHDIIGREHMQPAVWINTKTDYKLPLGPHCTDNRCAMYEVVDIQAPSKEEGYMQLGEEKKYDAGLNDLLERMYPEMLCFPCKEAVNIPERYY
ncbi:hypothetical protein HYX13_03575 [Candidatus Woesearchaeota archaeon]|nr:hypothetical protein [Candidatus Woesearchaeota archaeon]